MAYQRGDKFSFKVNVDIEILGYFPKGESRDGKAKYSATLNGIKMLIEEDFIENLKANEIKEEVKKEEVKEEVKVEKNKKRGKEKWKKKKCQILRQ